MRTLEPTVHHKYNIHHNATVHNFQTFALKQNVYQICDVSVTYWIFHPLLITGLQISIKMHLSFLNGFYNNLMMMWWSPILFGAKNVVNQTQDGAMCVVWLFWCGACEI